jgi:N-acetylglucosamine-6-phosphate deacetylase
MEKWIAASRIFTGTEWLTDHAALVSNGCVQRLAPSNTVQPDIKIPSDQFLLPGFIDAQVYGAAGKLLAVSPSAETLALMNEEFRKAGTILFQPTLATNSPDVFKSGIDAVRQYWQQGGKGVHGLHLEGPWLHPDKRGAHIKELIHPPSVDEARDLLEYGKGVITMITIAPEVCSREVTDLILSYGIVLSAGHSNATYGEAIRGFEGGISAVTHLYNAMSGLNHRAAGLVGATFNHHSTRSSIIPDGHHVSFEAVSIAKKIMGDRLFAITDAVTETKEGHYQHHFTGEKYECNGTLSGSALTMHEALLNLVRQVNIGLDEAIRMCSLYPAQVLRCDDSYGKIAPGSLAEFVVLNEDLELVDLLTA